MSSEYLLPAMWVGLLNLKTYSFRGLPLVQDTPSLGTHLLVVGSQRPHFHSLSFTGREHVLGRYPCLDAVPQDRCQALGNVGQTQDTHSAPLPLSKPMFSFSENWRDLSLMTATYKSSGAAYCVLGTVLSLFHTLPHLILIFTASLRVRCCC